MHPVEAVETFGVFFAHRRKDEWAEEGKPNLATVGVACEDEIDELPTRVGGDGVCVVRLVRQEDNWSVGFGRNREIQIGVAGAGVFQAAKPKAGAVFFDGDMLVDQDGSTPTSERVDDQGGADGDVVVAEYRVA